MNELEISLPSLRISAESISGSYEIAKPTMLLNLSDNHISITNDASKIAKMQARILNNCSLFSQGSHVLLLTSVRHDFLDVEAKLKAEIKASWPKAASLFPNLPALKQLAMYRSPKIMQHNWQLNFWFLEANSRGRIHQEHDFLELHLQVKGIGKMCKYYQADYASQYETMYMLPGFVHAPFFNNEETYPWHSYDAISDCLWLAIEEH